MALAPASAPPSASAPLELEPLRLPWDLRLSQEQFERVCQANPDAVLELAADGTLIAMTPTGGETSSRNGQILYQLQDFCRRRKGWRLFDSSGGFRLSDGSVLSPDASLVREERWQALSPEQRRGFPPLCPDLVVELASPSDEGPRGVSALRRKMETYQANGARLGWLLLPEERAVEIWRGGELGMAQRLEQATRLEAGEALAGVVLELEAVWTV
jgi:Uma2 family endonuclease